ncbi:MAG: ABC transporter permease [bacterium]
MNSLLVSIGRMIRRDRLYLLISVSGLALGMAVFLLMMAYVRDDLAWDSIHEKGDRICRVIQPRSFEGMGEVVAASVPIALGPALKEKIPEIVDMTRDFGLGQFFMQNGNHQGIYVQDTRFVDTSFFNIFTFPFVYGTPENAWPVKRSIVLEKKTANQLFGDVNPVGKALTISDTLTYTVSAVVDVPETGTHLGFDALIPVEPAAADFGFSQEWQYNNFVNVYTLLAEGADVNEVSEKIKHFMNDYINTPIVNSISLYLQPLRDIHLHSMNIGGRQIHPGNATVTMVFAIIAVLVLALAVINHINLSTARSIRRAREIGIRKTVGANRRQLIRQLMGESILVVTFAAVLASIAALLLQPVFEEVVGRKVGFQLFDGVFFSGVLLGMIPIVGILAGFYPALVISSLKPVSILGSAGAGFVSRSVLRRVLIVFQFVVSVAIVITTVMIYKQVRFSMSMNPGFNRDQVWEIQLHDDFMCEHSYELRDRISALNGVETASSCSDYLVGPTQSWSMKPEGTQSENWVASVYVMDPNGMDVFGFKLLKGRFLSWNHPGDPIGNEDSEGSIVITEATARDLGWENPIGKTFDIWGRFKVTVVGVIGDIRFQSARHKTEPIVILQRNAYWDGQFIAVRLKGGMIHETIQQIEEIWKNEFPGRPITSSFVDDHVESLYRTDEKLGNTLLAFTVVTFFIAFLGLLGLAVHSTERRSREIAIRKVLGASLANVNLLVVSEFARLILIANLIAWPLAWWFTNRWLKGFDYRMKMDWSVFLIAGFGTLMIAFVIVTIQAWHTVNRNPAEVIRDE